MASTYPTFLPGDVTPPFVHELARRMTGRFEVFVSTPHITGSRLSETQDGVQLRRYRYLPEKWQRLADGALLPNMKQNRWLVLQAPFLIGAEMGHVARLVRRERIDLVWAIWLLYEGAIMSLRRGPPFIATSMGADLFALNQPPIVALKRRVVRRSIGFSVLSRGMADKARELGLEKEPVVIPLGVDLDAFVAPAHLGLRERYDIRGPFLLFVGRLAEKKGVAHAIDAMARVASVDLTAKLLVVGTGPLEQSLRQQTARLGLEQRVLFAGGKPNRELPAYYAEADIFVGPSVTAPGGDSEGLGVVFVEALAGRCAVVTSRLPAIADIIEHERTGLAVDVQNSEELAAAILRLIADEPLRRRLADQGFRHVRQRFEWGAVAAEYADFLESCYRRRRCSAR